MASILENVSTFVTSVIGWMQMFLASIVGGSGTIPNSSTTYTYSAQPLLILFVIALPLCGLGIGILRRLIHTRG